MGIPNWNHLNLMMERVTNPIFKKILSIGYELETGGHVFHINLTNSAGLLENDYLPFNNKNWAQGGFRLGFTISRGFYFSKGTNAWTGKPKKTKEAQ